MRLYSLIFFKIKFFYLCFVLKTHSGKCNWDRILGETYTILILITIGFVTLRFENKNK